MKPLMSNKFHALTLEIFFDKVLGNILGQGWKVLEANNFFRGPIERRTPKKAKLSLGNGLGAVGLGGQQTTH
jgi:hypothetical protein